MERTIAWQGPSFEKFSNSTLIDQRCGRVICGKMREERPAMSADMRTISRKRSATLTRFEDRPEAKRAQSVYMRRSRRASYGRRCGRRLRSSLRRSGGGRIEVAVFLLLCLSPALAFPRLQRLLREKCPFSPVLHLGLDSYFLLLHLNTIVVGTN